MNSKINEFKNKLNFLAKLIYRSNKLNKNIEIFRNNQKKHVDAESVEPTVLKLCKISSQSISCENETELEEKNKFKCYLPKSPIIDEVESNDNLHAIDGDIEASIAPGSINSEKFTDVGEKVEPMEEEEDYEVEKIVDKRTCDERVAYNLKRKGYNEDHNIWEPVENLDCPDLIAEFQEQIKKKKQENILKETKEIKDKTKNMSSISEQDKEKPEEVSKPYGFYRVLVPENIISATDDSGEPMFLIKWFDFSHVFSDSKNSYEFQERF